MGGKEILKQMALVETDEEDKPKVRLLLLFSQLKTDLVIQEAIVYKNPFDEEEMKKEEIVQKEKEKKEKESVDLS